MSIMNELSKKTYEELADWLEGVQGRIGRELLVRFELQRRLIAAQNKLLKWSIIVAFIGVIIGAIIGSVLPTLVPAILSQAPPTGRKVSLEQSSHITTEILENESVAQAVPQGRERPVTKGEHEKVFF